ncbi:MAG: hypothetical protein K2H98_10255, partial [Duncaniella sp.]|nr:hypothetical protein [Duncaniella sp.]
RRIKNNDGTISYGDQDVTDFNVGVIEVERGRTYIDSTIVIKHYPDGSSRSITTRYIYNDRENTTLDQFPDETKIAGSLHRPSGTVVECAGTKIEKYDLLGENIKNLGKYFTNYKNQSLRALPVISRVKVDGRVFTTRNYYESFGDNLLPRRMVTVGHDGSTVIDEMSVTAYNTCRQPQRIVRRGRPTMVYTYQTDGMGLASSCIDGTELKNTYTYKSLVGYTSITTPAGNKTQYQYTGSRLTGILDRDGKLVKGYEYHLFDPQEFVHGYIRERQYLNSAGTASVTTTSLFDSYGEQYATIAGAASAPGVDIVSFTALDAIGRQRRQYLPFTIPSDYSYQELALFGDSIAKSFSDDAVPFSEAIFKAGSSSATPVIT